MTSILAFGGVYLDINATNFPISSDADQLINTETVGNEYEMVLGGSALNVARFSSKLGMSSFFVGKVGTDKTAQLLKELFLDEGIAPFLIEDSSKTTNLNTNLVGNHGESLMLSFGNANASLTTENVLSFLKQNIQEIDYVYMGGVFKLKTILPNILKLAAFVQSQGKKVVLDHGRIINTAREEEKEIVRQLALTSDIYLPSKDEFLELWNVQTIEEGLYSLSEQRESTGTIIVKDSDNGAWTLENGKLVHVPAFKVNVVNTVGAGDSFNVGFIAAHSEGKSLEESIRFANATAALKISQNHFPSNNEITDYLKYH